MKVVLNLWKYKNFNCSLHNLFPLRMTDIDIIYIFFLFIKRSNRYIYVHAAKTVPLRLVLLVSKFTRIRCVS